MTDLGQPKLVAVTEAQKGTGFLSKFKPKEKGQEERTGLLGIGTCRLFKVGFIFERHNILGLFTVYLHIHTG